MTKEYCFIDFSKWVYIKRNEDGNIETNFEIDDKLLRILIIKNLEVKQSFKIIEEFYYSSDYHFQNINQNLANNFVLLLNNITNIKEWFSEYHGEYSSDSFKNQINIIKKEFDDKFTEIKTQLFDKGWK